jgi:hypothetical protein
VSSRRPAVGSALPTDADIELKQLGDRLLQEKCPVTLTSSAGRLRVCRRFLLLIYATAVVYFFYAPSNYVLLGVLLFIKGRVSQLRSAPQ